MLNLTKTIHFFFILICPQAGQASSPQCSGDFSLVLSFGGSKRKNIEGEYLLSCLKLLN
jgi:hypothetical protein